MSLCQESSRPPSTSMADMADDSATSSASEPAPLYSHDVAERRRYSTLELSRSSYDNVLLSLLKSEGALVPLIPVA